MSYYLVLGEHQSGKTSLIKSCLNDQGAQPIEVEGVQIWEDQRNNINYVEICTNSKTKYKHLKKVFPGIKTCKSCWFLISALKMTEFDALLIYSLMGRGIEIIFIISKSGIEKYIFKNFGNKPKTIYFEEFGSQRSILHLAEHPAVKEHVSKEKNQQLSTKQLNHQFQIDESNNFNSKILIDSMNKYFFKNVDIFFVQFKSQCVYKEQFMNDLIGRQEPIDHKNENLRTYVSSEDRIKIHDVFETCNDEMTILNIIHTLRSKDNASQVIVALFASDGNNEQEQEFSINEKYFDFPIIIISHDSRMRFPANNVIGSDDFIQQMNDDNISFDRNVIINHEFNRDNSNQSIEIFNKLLPSVTKKSFIDSPMFKNSFKASFHDKEIIASKFSILVIGGAKSGKTTLVKVMLFDSSNDATDSDDGFSFSRGEIPITFIEYHGKIQSKEDLKSFHRKFKPILEQYDVLVCWNTSIGEPDSFMQRLTNELDKKYHISSVLIFTNVTDPSSSHLSENPSKFKARSICWIPSISQRIEGCDLNSSMNDILTQTKSLLPHESYQNTVNLFIDNRNNTKDSICINEYEEFQFDVSKLSNVANELGTDRLNLMIIGPTGAGKSTLINALYGSKTSEVSHVKPCTMGFTEYRVINCPINLIDSRGFEIEEFGSIKETTMIEIENRLPVDSKRIHMVLYCVKSQSNRFTDAEYEIVESIRAKGIPVIVVVTHSSRDNGLYQAIKTDRYYPHYQDLKTSLNKQDIIGQKVIVIKVLAEEESFKDKYDRKIIVKPYGLQNLIDLMSEYLPEQLKYVSTQMKKNLNPNLSPMINAISSSKVNMINIMVIGDSGAGKSQLIKTIFGLDIESNVGKFVTPKIEKFMIKGKPLSVFDTVGFEYNRYQEIKNEIFSLIISKAKEDDPSKHIHIIWYVINDGKHRIEENDKEIISYLMKLGIPIIIVLNNGEPCHLDCKQALMNGFINGYEVPDLTMILSSDQENRRRLINRKISVIKTNAKESCFSNKVLITVYGTAELVQLTQLYIDVAADNALHTSIVNLKCRSNLLDKLSKRSFNTKSPK